MTTKEIWRSVPSVEGAMVSSMGRVMRAPFRSSNPRTGDRQYGGVPTSGQWDGKRYLWMCKGRTYKVARLVCEAFNGPSPPGMNVCMHLDENSKNNVPSNLAWGTQKQNLNAPGFIAYCEGRVGENSPLIKSRKKAA